MNLLAVLTERDIGSDPEPLEPSPWRLRRASRAILFNVEGRVAIMRVAKDSYAKLPGAR